MDEKLKLTYLFDFYGDLLNEHQQSVLEDFVFNDYSLTEIAEEEGISRQGVCDMVKRCEKKLNDYENKLHLVEKFLSIKSDVAEINRLAEISLEAPSAETMNEIRRISNGILEVL